MISAFLFQNFYPLLLGMFAAAGLSFLGVFVIVRRMALVGDALSHVALPGMALGLLYGFSPLLGGFGALLLAAMIIANLQKHTRLKSEILIGILFSAALALGLIIAPEHELIEALFGDLSSVGLQEFWWGVGLSAILLAILLMWYRRFVFVTFSEELAHVNGIDVSRVNFIFLLTIVIGVVLGIRVVGTLLVGSLLIIPPATAQGLARGLKQFFILSILVGVVSIIGGLFVAWNYQLPPGAAIVLMESVLFLLSLFLKSLLRR